VTHDPPICRDRIRETLDLIANKWAVPIFVELTRSTTPLRFSELSRAIPGITQKELTKQLRELESAKLVSRTVYPVVPPKVEYALTDLGWSLHPVMDALARWADQYAGVLAANKAAAAQTTSSDARENHHADR